MERKSSIKDIHKVIQKDLVELYKTMNVKLGADNPFAKFSIGGGFYLWSDSRNLWQQMISASTVEQSLIRDKVFESRKFIAEKFGEKTAETLFTIPDESYIYYAYNGDDIEILIAGWGFRKPVRAQGTPDYIELDKKNPISLSFVDDGSALANYAFDIVLQKQVKRLHTNSNGLYNFSNLKVGESLELIDSKTKRHFTLIVREGVNHYDFDVSTTCMLNVKVLQDGSPMIGETVEIKYDGNSNFLRTDFGGIAAIKLVFHENMEISASVKDETKTETILEGGNNIVFSFTTPKQEEEAPTPIPEEETIEESEETIEKPEITPDEDKVTDTIEETVSFIPHILVQGTDGYIGHRYPITVVYNGKTVSCISDDNGIVQLDEVTEGEKMTVSDDLNPENTAEYTFDSERPEYIFHIPYGPMSMDQDIKVTIRNRDDKAIACDKIRFRQKGGVDYLMNFTEDGVVYFANDAFEMNKDISVELVNSQKDYGEINFRMTEDEKEYLLQERKPKAPWWKTAAQIAMVPILGAIAWGVWTLFIGII